MKTKLPNFGNLFTGLSDCCNANNRKLSGNSFKALVMLLLMVLMSPLAVLAQGGPSADLDQIRNGGKTTPVDPPAWVNGNANGTQAHYLEGHSIAYRMVIDGLGTNANTWHTLVIAYDHLKGTNTGNKHALDYITHYRNLDPHNMTAGGPFNHDAENIKPLLGLTGISNDSIEKAVIMPLTALNANAQASFTALATADKAKFIMYGGGAGAVIEDMTLASYSFAGEETQLIIRFKSSNNKVVLLWGGHIATSTDWGTGMSAVAIDGSPYHTRLISIDGKGGNQDRALQSAAVTQLDPPTCDVNGDPIICRDGIGAYSAISDGTQTGYSWEFTDIVLAAGGSVNPSFLTPSVGATVTGATADAVTVDPGDAVSFKVKVTISKLSAQSSTCDIEVAVEDVTAEVVSDGDLTCDDGTVRVSASLMGSLTLETPTYEWSLDGNPIPDSNVPFLDVTVAGTYSVTIRSNSTADGCDATDEVIVEDHTAKPEITITPRGTITCDPNSATTLVASLSNIPGYIDPNMISYAWTKVGDATVLGTTDTYMATDDGTYRVTVEFDETGCSEFADQIVTEDKTPPTVEANGPYSIACEGNNVVAISGTSDGASVLWSVSPVGAGTFADATMLSTNFSFNPGYTSATLRLTATGANTCEAYDEAQVTQEPCVGPKHCTLTQGAYGNSNGKFCGDPLQRKRSFLIAELLMPANGGAVVVGIPGNSLSLGTSACIIEKLPAGGPALVLPGGNFTCGNIPASILDKKSKKFNNVLIGQIVTLTLNMRLDDYFFDNTLQDVELTAMMTTAAASTCGSGATAVPFTEMTWTIPASILTYFSNNAIDPTVGNLLLLANQAIGGASGKPSLSDINKAVSAVNEMFDECRMLITTPVGVPVRLANASAVIPQSLKAYPNPFSDVSTIEFSVAENVNYSLNVFDVTGRIVATLGAGNAEAGKVYTFKVGEQRLPEGIYLVKLNAGSKVETIKIILKR